MIGLSFNKVLGILFIIIMISNTSVVAQNIPGSADAGRIQPSSDLSPNLFPNLPGNKGNSDSNFLKSPEGSDGIIILLNAIEFEGLSAFSKDELKPLYRDFLNQEIPLSTIWNIANKITKLYQDNGFFISRAIIPQQEIDDGIIVIEIIEGHIGDVNINGSQHFLASDITNSLKNEKPIRFASLESALLRLNDIYGLTFKSTLRTLPPSLQTKDNQYGVQLYLTGVREKSNGNITFNNYGSQFAGPNRMNLAYQTSFQNGHMTTLSALTDGEFGEELWAGSVRHDINLKDSMNAFASYSKTVSKPGFTLEENDILSESTAWQIGADWQPLRQRHSNFKLTGSLNSQDVETDILRQVLTKDYIRTLVMDATFDITNDRQTKNIFQLTYTQGLSILGASDEGDVNLSRSAADPKFSKIEFLYQRDQIINGQFLLTSKLQGQKSDSPLFSSQEFGFGGQGRGRAYDNAEISGDNGIAAFFEAKYMNIPTYHNIKYIPSAFYDIGKVWNIDSGQDNGVSASSAGIGLNFYNQKYNYFGSVSLAIPLTKKIETPLYGRNQSNPRLSFQLGYQF